MTDGRLPEEEVAELRTLAGGAVGRRRPARAGDHATTLDGVLNSFRTRIPALARQLEAQVAFRDRAAHRRGRRLHGRARRDRRGHPQRLVAARRGARPLAGLRRLRRHPARAAPAHAPAGSRARRRSRLPSGSARSGRRCGAGAGVGHRRRRAAGGRGGGRPLAATGPASASGSAATPGLGKPRTSCVRRAGRGRRRLAGPHHRAGPHRGRDQAVGRPACSSFDVESRWR